MKKKQSAGEGVEGNRSTTRQARGGRGRVRTDDDDNISFLLAVGNLVKAIERVKDKDDCRMGKKHCSSKKKSGEHKKLGSC
jgi:hypothetical protein